MTYFGLTLHQYEDVTAITRKYMSLIYNPIIESQGGARLITLEGWNNPDTLTTQFVADVAQGSHNLVSYVAGPRVELDEYPVKEDGFQYTDETFMACLGNVALCNKPDQAQGFGYAIDYLVMLNKNNICAARCHYYRRAKPRFFVCTTSKEWITRESPNCCDSATGRSPHHCPEHERN